MTHRILITGGFGYIGGRTAQWFAARPGMQVVLGSRVPRIPPDWLPSASVVPTSWRDPESLRLACSGVDTILHLAAMNEVEAAQDPIGALEVNAVATVRLVEAAKAAKVTRFIYLSTAHVYRAPLAGRIDETACPRPAHPYASSHRAAEDVVLAAHDAGYFAGLVLRLSNGFGAPAHPHVNRWTLLVNDLCRQAVTEGRLVLRSAGLQRRDFVTLADVAGAISHVEALPREKIGDGIFNVGGAWAPTVLEMTALVAARCRHVLGSSPSIHRPDPAPDAVSDPLDYRIDKLIETGFKLAGDREAEIDATLTMCSAQAAGRTGSRGTR